MNAIYETDFLGFSYGFRPGRNQHQALDALYVGITQKKVNWVLDADIRSFFDTLDHGWLVKFLEHRVSDQRVVRLVQKWLNAGVLVDGRVEQSKVGTVQGGSVSPLLANVYLHYVFDLWVQQWREKANGDVIVVRYADDFVVGFQHRNEAERFLRELRERFAKFKLELHPDKTRLFEFGRFAAENRKQRGEGKPESFNFLGFTHICGKTAKGWFLPLRHTMRKRLAGKLVEIAAELRGLMNKGIPAMGAYLRAVLKGHFQYYGVPTNGRALNTFRYHVAEIWRRALMRRSQKHRITWERIKRLVARWLPPAHICHPYPNERLRVGT